MCRLWLLPFFLIAFCAMITSAAEVPVPEFFGTYAVFGDKLLGLDVSTSTAEPRMVSVEFALRASPTDLIDGKPAATRRTMQIPEAPPTIKFIVFIQASGVMTSMVAAKDMRLAALPYVMMLKNNSGWPSSVRRSAMANGWDPVFGDQIELLLKPVPNHSDMVIAQPAKPLIPGVYRIAGGTLDHSFKFAVGSVETAKEGHCVNMDCMWIMGLPDPKCAVSKCGENETAAIPPETAATGGPARSNPPFEAVSKTRTGEGMLVIVNDARIYQRSDGDTVKLRAPLGASLANATGGILGVPMSYQPEEKDGRVHVVFLRPPRGSGGPTIDTGWMNPSDVARFTYDCSCEPTRCHPALQKGLSIAGWNTCFASARDKRRSELFTEDGKLKASAPKGK